MLLLDAVANIAPYAFILPYIWIMTAFVIAAVRVRDAQPRRRVLSIAAKGLSVLFWPFWLILLSNSVRNINEPVWWLFWYVYFIVFPLLTIYGLRPTSKSIPLWRKIGFTSLDDFLLFRPLPSDQATIDLPEVANPKRWVNRSTLWLMLLVSVCATGVSFIGNSLQTCEWLDIATGRSGCLRTMSFDNISVGEIAFSPDGRVMATSSWRGPLQLYDMTNGQMLHELPDRQTECGRSVSFSPDNRWVATISKDGAVLVSDVQTGQLVHSLKTITNTYSINFHPTANI